MERPDIDQYWMSMLALVASRGTCPRRQVGAILVDCHGRLVSTGYNGTAAGMAHCVDAPCPGSPALGGQRDDCEALHAESNAVAQALGSGRAPYTLYCGLTPCFPCAKLLQAVGVRQVVAAAAYAHDDRGPALLVKGGAHVWVWNGRAKTPWKSGG